MFHTLICLLFLLCRHTFLFCFLRFSMGSAFGLALPLTTTMMVEHLPPKNRGRWVICINLFMTFGKLFGLMLAFFCLETFYDGDWRLLIALTAIPPAIVSVCGLFFVYESPRFCLFNGRDSDCYKNLSKIRLINRKFPAFRFKYCKNLILENGNSKKFAVFIYFFCEILILKYFFRC